MLNTCSVFLLMYCKECLTTFAILGQTYLQSLTIRLEEMRVKRRDSEQWMHHRMLPQDLRERVRRYDQYKWLETRGVDEEYLVQNLPKDLRRDIKRHLCLALVRRVRSPTALHSNFMPMINGVFTIIFRFHCLRAWTTSFWMRSVCG